MSSYGTAETEKLRSNVEEQVIDEHTLLGVGRGGLTFSLQLSWLTSLVGCYSNSKIVKI
jgi:hypothetical protein